MTDASHLFVKPTTSFPYQRKKENFYNNPNSHSSILIINGSGLSLHSSLFTHTQWTELSTFAADLLGILFSLSFLICHLLFYWISFLFFSPFILDFVDSFFFSFSKWVLRCSYACFIFCWSGHSSCRDFKDLILLIKELIKKNPFLLVFLLIDYVGFPIANHVF